MLTFANVDYPTFKIECETLRQLHYLEILAPRGYNLSVDHDFYERLEDNLRIIVAYWGEQPVGYHIALISYDIHDDTKPLVQTDMYFLEKDFRKGRNGIELFKVAHADLAVAAPGAAWRLTVPIDGERDLGVLVERVLGGKPTERLYEVSLPSEE